MNKIKLKSFVANKRIRKLLGKSKMQKPLTNEVVQLLTSLEQHSTNISSYTDYNNPSLKIRCDYHLAESYFLQICNIVVLELYALKVARPIINVLLNTDLNKDSMMLFRELFDKDGAVREAVYFFKNQTLEFQPKT